MERQPVKHNSVIDFRISSTKPRCVEISFGTDAYIEGFKKGPSIETEGTPEEAVRVVKEGLENEFRGNCQGRSP